MSTASDVPETGQLPGRYEFVPETTRGVPPTDPAFQLASDVMRTFEAEGGASVGRQDSLSTADAVDHNRGMEEPSLSVGYDMQQFPVDGSGNAQTPAGYGIIRDQYNRLAATLTWIGRLENPGGNDNSGVYEYTVALGCAAESVEATLDPSSEDPILMELDYQPAKVRSYKIHQPSAGTTLDIVSTSDNDTMDITIENDDASTSDTVTLTGTTPVTTTESFAEISQAWLASAPEGDITITDGSGTNFMTLTGGSTYSDDNNPVDGDRGVPVIGAGSHASAIGTSYEHFVGDRFERPSGSAVRPRVNSASWSVENDISTSALHDTRAPAINEGNRTTSVDADIAGEFVSHESMMESLQKAQNNLEHELDGGIITFSNTVPTGAATRTLEADQAAASLSETLEASGDPSISLSST